MYMYNGLCDVICVGASKVLVKGGMCVLIIHIYQRLLWFKRHYQDNHVRRDTHAHVNSALLRAASREYSACHYKFTIMVKLTVITAHK